MAKLHSCEHKAKLSQKEKKKRSLPRKAWCNGEGRRQQTLQRAQGKPYKWLHQSRRKLKNIRRPNAAERQPVRKPTRGLDRPIRWDGVNSSHLTGRVTGAARRPGGLFFPRK